MVIYMNPKSIPEKTKQNTNPSFPTPPHYPLPPPKKKKRQNFEVSFLSGYGNLGVVSHSLEWNKAKQIYFLNWVVYH